MANTNTSLNNQITVERRIKKNQAWN